MPAKACNRGRFWPWWVLAAAVVWLVPVGWSAEATTVKSVFAGPQAEYEDIPPGLGDSEQGHEVLRWVWVEERVNVARQGAAVRVPVFFATGECARAEDVELVRWPSREPVVSQADDIRLGADGGVARLHLWFSTDLGAGENRRYALVRRVSAAAAVATPIKTRSVAGKIQLTANGSLVSFFSETAQRGRLARLELTNGPVLDFAAGASPTVSWSVTDDGTVRSSDDAGQFMWGAGPVFAKVTVLMRDQRGSEVQQTFRLFGDGSLNLVQTVRPSSDSAGMTLTVQDFISGKLSARGDLSVSAESAGMVESLVGVHPGYALDTLLAEKKAQGWLVIPGTLGGVAGRVVLNRDGLFRVQAPGKLTRDSGDARAGTVRAFWSEVTFIPARIENGLVDAVTRLSAAQPLVAVVERPGATLAMATDRLKDNVREIKPVGWVNESVVRFLQGKADPFSKRRWATEGDPSFWVAESQRAYAKVTEKSGSPPTEEQKGRAAGSLDPYHITYQATPLAYWLSQGALPDPIKASTRARMEAVRRQLARTDDQGWPYLDVFFRTQNMQMGPPFLALADSGADPELRRFYRDQLASPTIAAVQLRGLRPYQGSPQVKPNESDTIYQAVVDFYLRATEISLNESLGLQAVAFGRYLDAVDVNADLYHPAHPRSADEGGRFARANFFRTQSHLHRWLAWGPAPFVALLKPPLPGVEGFPGATEAWQFAHMLAGRWKNWPDQSWLFLASVLPEKTAAYSPAPRPAPTKAVTVQSTAKGNRISWDGEVGAVAYRIYRLRRESSPVWLNSPYRQSSGNAPSALEWWDEAGKPDDRYRVHIVTAAGQESAW